jgi:hypothetical protein
MTMAPKTNAKGKLVSKPGRADLGAKDPELEKLVEKAREKEEYWARRNREQARGEPSGNEAEVRAAPGNFFPRPDPLSR